MRFTCKEISEIKVRSLIIECSKNILNGDYQEAKVQRNLYRLDLLKTLYRLNVIDYPELS